MKSVFDWLIISYLILAFPTSPIELFIAAALSILVCLQASIRVMVCLSWYMHTFASKMVIAKLAFNCLGRP